MLVVAVPAGVGGQEASDTDDALPEVDARITAQRHENDHVEFALQLRVEDDPWTDRILPRLRFFPPDVEIGRWLGSSTLSVQREPTPEESIPAAEVELRITAQRVDGDRIEFALQQRAPGEAWGERLLPSRRFFPKATEVGRWLVSSPLAVQLTVIPTAPEPAATGEDDTAVDDTTGDDEPAVEGVSDDLLDFDMIDVQTGETVNIRSLVDGETPLLFWLWSPY